MNRLAFLGELMLAILALCSSPAAGQDASSEWLPGIPMIQLVPDGTIGPAPMPWANNLRFRKHSLDDINRTLRGQVVDYTNNHGTDRRIWSDALHERRDLYVYLPPGYDPLQAYPLVIWLHQIADDERSFLRDVVSVVDTAIVAGNLPPMIIAVPDGSVLGHPCLLRPGSFFVNSEAGCFEDWIMQEVWKFMFSQYPLRPEREAHALLGVSMGGFAAYNLGFKYRDRIGVVAGLLPPLNIRWEDCHGRAMGNFDPNCWGWRERIRGREVVGRFYGAFTIRTRLFVYPLYGRGQQSLAILSRENPIEMLDRLDVQPGEQAMYIGYGAKDQFNVDAQVESFLYRARQRGLSIEVAYDPQGKHDVKTALRLAPGVFAWLTRQLAPYSPGAAISCEAQGLQPLGLTVSKRGQDP